MKKIIVMCLLFLSIIIFSKDYTKIEDLPKNAKIGTSSIRREMQLKNINIFIKVLWYGSRI